MCVSFDKLGFFSSSANIILCLAVYLFIYDCVVCYLSKNMSYNILSRMCFFANIYYLSIFDTLQVKTLRHTTL